MSDLKPITVKAELFFVKDAYVLNKFFDEENEKYMLTVGNLSEAASEALEGLNIRVKHKELQGRHVVGKSKFQFKFYSEDGEEIPASKIGNGSVAKVLIAPYNHKLSKKFGASPSIKKVIVTELKEYNPERALEEEDTVL